MQPVNTSIDDLKFEIDRGISELDTKFFIGKRLDALHGKVSLLWSAVISQGLGENLPDLEDLKKKSEALLTPKPGFFSFIKRNLNNTRLQSLVGKIQQVARLTKFASTEKEIIQFVVMIKNRGGLDEGFKVVESITNLQVKARAFVEFAKSGGIALHQIIARLSQSNDLNKLIDNVEKIFKEEKKNFDAETVKSFEDFLNSFHPDTQSKDLVSNELSEDSTVEDEKRPSTQDSERMSPLPISPERSSESSVDTMPEEEPVTQEDREFSSEIGTPELSTAQGGGEYAPYVKFTEQIGPNLFQILNGITAANERKNNDPPKVVANKKAILVTFEFKKEKGKFVPELAARNLFISLDLGEGLAGQLAHWIPIKINFPKEIFGVSTETECINFQTPSKTVLFTIDIAPWIMTTLSTLTQHLVFDRNLLKLVGTSGLNSLRTDSEGNVIIGLRPVDRTGTAWKKGNEGTPVIINLGYTHLALGFWDAVRNADS